MKNFHIKDVNEISYFFKKIEKIELNECIGKMKKIKGSNKTQIARIIRINRIVIERIWNKLQ